MAKRGVRKERALAARLASCRGKYLGYIRVSTVTQSEDGYSLGGQEARLRERAASEGLELVGVISDVESGAKQRDGMDEAWERAVSGQVEGIMFMRLDRLGRSLTALSTLVDSAEDLHIGLYAVDGGWQVRNGETVNNALPVLMGVAQMERKLISLRTREGLAAARAKGVRLGRAATNTAEEGTVLRLKQEGMTFREIAARLNQEGKRTANGRDYAPGTVWLMHRRALEASASAS